MAEQHDNDERPNTITSEPETSQETSQSILVGAISKNTKILALFAIACTAIVGLVNELTKSRIHAQEQLQLVRTLSSIIEPSRYDNDIANDCVIISTPELGTHKAQKIYVARKEGDVVAVAITSNAPEGYNGNIQFILAINIDNSVSGIRVLKHQETPGLGDKIELRKDDWITFFSGKKLSNEDDSRWAVKKDGGMFDQFTGATITPRALVSGIKNTLNYFVQHKNDILKQENSCALASPEMSIEPKGHIEGEDQPSEVLSNTDVNKTTEVVASASETSIEKIAASESEKSNTTGTAIQASQPNSTKNTKNTKSNSETEDE